MFVGGGCSVQHGAETGCVGVAYFLRHGVERQVTEAQRGRQRRSTGKRGRVSAERSARPSGRRRAERLVGVRRVSAGGDEMSGHATRRQVIAGVLVPRGVRAGTDAGHEHGQWPSPHCLHPKSDGSHFGLREKWRRSGAHRETAPTIPGHGIQAWRPARAIHPARGSCRYSGAGFSGRTEIAPRMPPRSFYRP